MSKKQAFYVAFFAVLVVGFMAVMAFVVPDFFKTKFPPISEVGAFSFVNEKGERVTEKDIKGKVVAVNFFFTTCKSICPKMSNNLLPIYNEFKNNDEFLILSHTSDPERDSVPVLKRYADSLGVAGNRWMFLTGRKDSLYAAARHQYRIDDPNNFVQASTDEFLHTQFVALVNRKGEVIHIYDGIKPSEMKEMQTKVRELLEKKS